MSEFWNSGEEIYQAIIGMFEKIAEDPAVVKKLENIKYLTLYDYHDPDVKIWIDGRGEEASHGMGDPPGEPDVTMSLSADDAHRAWSNKLNVMLAITKKKVKITGNATKMLKLTPLLKKFAVAYNESLREMGKEDIILK